MKVILAGYNTDTENGSTTPETISAAYARISRDPAPITELRKQSSQEIEQNRRARSAKMRVAEKLAKQKLEVA